MNLEQGPANLGQETKTFYDPMKELILIIPEEEEQETGKQKGEWPDMEFEGEPPPSESKTGPPATNPWQEVEKPSPIDEQTVKDFLAKQKEKEREERREKREEDRGKRLTPQEKMNQANKLADQQFAERHGVPANVAAQYRNLDKSVEKYKPELAQVFEEIMQSISRQVVLLWEEGFRSGRFNVERLIQKYGQYLQEGAPIIQFDQLDIYDQRDFLERLRLFPEKIRLRLVCDGSASMNEQRIMALKQIFVLILESLNIFEYLINLRFKLKKPFQVDTEVIMFGSRTEAKIAKPFSAETNFDREEDRANRLRAFEVIKGVSGSTCAAEPWWKIDASLNEPQYLEDLKTGRAKEIIFEITDGGANAAWHLGVNPTQDARNAIHAVSSKGVIARGFQIGDPSEDEKKIFDSIWGQDGQRLEHLNDLVPAAAKLLALEIRKIRMQLIYEEGEED